MVAVPEKVQDGVEEEEDEMYLEESVAEFCSEYVQLSKELTDMSKQRKRVNDRLKEVSIKIMSIMNNSGIDEINVGGDHKILLMERKSTTSLKEKEVCNLIVSKLGDSDAVKDLLNDLKGMRVQTVKDALKLKK